MSLRHSVRLGPRQLTCECPQATVLQWLQLLVADLIQAFITSVLFIKFTSHGKSKKRRNK